MVLVKKGKGSQCPYFKKSYHTEDTHKAFDEKKKAEKKSLCLSWP